jgi:DNA-directed RNA polymerase beta subunit
MIRIGAEVKPGDILIGKITPKENQILLQKRNCFVQSSGIKQVIKMLH